MTATLESTTKQEEDTMPEAARLDMDARPTLEAIVAADPMVSSHSRWSSPVWTLDADVGGRSPAAFSIHWGVKAPRRLVDEAKLLAALLFLERDGRTEYAPSTTCTFSVGIRHLLRFMTTYAYSSFAELDADAFALFRKNLHIRLSDPEWWSEEFEGIGSEGEILSDVENRELTAAAEAFDLEPEAAASRPAPKAKDRKPDRDDLTRTSAYTRLRPWRQLVEHAHAMQAAGARAIEHNPYASVSIWRVSDEVSSVASVLIPPLPDKVALRIMARALALIAQPAEDVIELQRRYLAVLPRTAAEPGAADREAGRTVLRDFVFSKIDGAPWRAPIVMSDDEASGWHLRRLIDLIRDAAVLTIFAGTGVRISELCSLTADPDPAPPATPLFPEEAQGSALPHCVTTAVSKTGLNEHLFMNGRLFKNQRTPVEERWLIGARPRGDDVEPPVLRAIRVLERLYLPWRRVSGDPKLRSQLILGMQGGALPRTKGLLPISADLLRTSSKGFIATECGLEQLAADAETDRKLAPYVRDKGACIRPHQWRKTFALYMMKVDDRMIPALAHHFKHLSIAVTENSYMPTDPSMLAAHDSVHAQEAARWFYEQRHGAGGSFGRLDEIMAEHRAEWEKLVADLPFDEAVPIVQRFCLDKDIRIFNAEHGRCVIAANPDRARCHEAAGTVSWRNAVPNHMARTPGLCAGCSNFSVAPEHAGYWRRRFASHQSSWLGSDRSPQFRAVQKRAQQAAAVLQALGVPLPVILTEAPSDRARRKRRNGKGAQPPTAIKDGQEDAA